MMEYNFLIVNFSRHLLQPILQYRSGIDEARPVGPDQNHIQGIGRLVISSFFNIHDYRLALHPPSFRRLDRAP